MAFKTLDINAVEEKDGFPFALKQGKVDLSTTEEVNFESGFRALTGGELKTKMVDLRVIKSVLRASNLLDKLAPKGMLTFPAKTYLVISSKTMKIVQEGKKDETQKP